MLRVRACRQFLIPFTPLGLYEVDIVSQKEMKAQKLVGSLSRSSIAFVNHSVDRSLFIRLIAIRGELGDLMIADRTLRPPHLSLSVPSTSARSSLIFSTASGSGRLSPPNSKRMLNLISVPIAACVIAGI